MMENLIIEHKTSRMARGILGTAMLLYVIISLIAGKESPGDKNWVLWIMLTLLGLMQFLPSDLDKTRIDPGNGFLEITWPNRRKIKVQDSEIDRITLSTNYVFIFRKDKKAIKLVLYGKDQKTQVFEYLSTYALEKNLTLVNQDEEKS